MDHQRNTLVLPNEVLEHIFSFLSVQDKLASSLVCKQWLEVMKNPQLIEEIRIRFTSKVDNIQLLSLSRKFSKLIFFRLTLSRQHFTFLKEYSENIKSLTFYSCYTSFDITDSDSENLGFCSNLRVLRFYDCFFHFYHFLPKLKELYIDTTIGLSDHAFAVFNATMPDLEILQLKYLWVMKDVEQEVLVENPSKVILTYPFVFDFIQKRAETLKCLSFNDRTLERAAALETFKIKNLKLKKLILQTGSNCTRCNVLPQLCYYQPFLTELVLVSVSLMNDDIIDSICILLPLLECLIIRTNNSFNYSIRSIFQLENLHTLELTRCSGIKRMSFHIAFFDFKLFKLEKLILQELEIDKIIVENIVKKVKCLQYLKLSDYDMTEDKELFDWISQQVMYFEYRSFLSTVTYRKGKKVHPGQFQR